MSASEADDMMMESWLEPTMTPFERDEDSNAEQPKESGAWTEHVLEVLRVRRKPLMEECLPPQKDEGSGSETEALDESGDTPSRVSSGGVMM